MVSVLCITYFSCYLVFELSKHMFSGHIFESNFRDTLVIYGNVLVGMMFVMGNNST